MDRDLWCVVFFFMTYALFPAKAPPLINPEHLKADVSKRNQDNKCSLCIVRRFYRSIIIYILVSKSCGSYFDASLQETVKIVQDTFQSNHTLDDVFPLLEKLCIDLMKDYSSAAYMCPGMIFSYGPVVCCNKF